MVQTNGTLHVPAEKAENGDFVRAISTPPSSNQNTRRKSLSEEAQKLKKMASHLVIEVPVTQYHNMKHRDAIGSLHKEIQLFVGITSMHGVLRTYRSKRLSKLFWGLMVVVSCVLMIYQIVIQIKQYASGPTSSQASFIVDEQKSLFPVVTVCNFNPIKKSFVQRVLNRTGDLPLEVVRYLHLARIDIQSLSVSSSLYDMQRGEVAFRAYQARHPDFSISRFFRAAGFQCEDTLKVCALEGRQFDCCKHSTPVLTDLGLCHMLELNDSTSLTFNNYKSSHINNHGLHILLDANVADQFEDDGISDPTFVNSFDYGFRFHVHHKDVISYISTEGTVMSPGMRVFSAMQANKFNLLKKDNWGKCQDEWPSTFENPILPYTAANCEAMCTAKYFAERCGCAPYQYNIDGRYIPCTPKQLLDCNSTHVRLENPNDYEFVQPSCSECGIECTSWSYDTFSSYGTGFTRGSMQWLSTIDRKYTPQYIPQNLATVNVFFRDMAHTEYNEQITTSVTQLLSNIGGNMGLFLGISLITVVETFMFFIKATWIFLSKRRRNYLNEKKRREKEKQREIEETMEHLRRNPSALRTISEQIIPHKEEPEPPQERANTGPKRSLQKLMDIAGSIRKNSPMRRQPVVPSSAPPFTALPSPLRRAASVDVGTRTRREFMNHFYNSKLFGNGTVEDPKPSTILPPTSESSESVASSEDDKVIELKIDLKELEKRLEKGDATIQPIETQVRKRTLSLAGVDTATPTSKVEFAFDPTVGIPEEDRQSKSSSSSSSPTHSPRASVHFSPPSDPSDEPSKSLHDVI